MGRKRFTGTSRYPQAWQLAGDILYDVQVMCKGQIYICIKSTLTKFVHMTPKDANKSWSYVDTFVSSGAPEALVKLYKLRAYDFIRDFIITFSNDELQIPIYTPLVLKFCKLLCSAVTYDDPLYIFCRASLELMLNKTSIIIVQDIFPFVDDELATKLSQGLVSSRESIGTCPITDVHKFYSFLRFMMNGIIGRKNLGTHIPRRYYQNRPWYNHHQLGDVYSVYLNLMEKMQTCLTEMADEIKITGNVKQDGGWDQYLPILKQLHSISQLYEGAEETFLTSLRPNEVALSHLVIRYAEVGNEYYKWILDHKDLIDFESRRHLAMMLVPKVTYNYEDEHKMLINRSHILDESFSYFLRADPSTLLDPISIEFINEEATGDGVLREWFMLVCQAIFNPQNALFLACPTDRRRFFPNPASKVNPVHLEYFEYAGRVIALALVHKMQVGIVFGRAFFLQLAGIQVSLEDIKDADPYLYSSCKQILEMDPCAVDQDVLGLTFTWEVEELGVKKVVELRPDGEQICVNSINRNQYIDLIVEHQFVTSIAEQSSHFSKGFVDIVGNEENENLFFKSLEHEDLDRILRGSESGISVDDWKAHTLYNGYKETDIQINWFWKIVGDMSVEQRKLLLFFWTAVKYLPVEGFCGLDLRLCITKSDETCDRLPSSHTCFYQLRVPAYPSMEVMQQHLNIITDEHVGCSFGIGDTNR